MARTHCAAACIWTLVVLAQVMIAEPAYSAVSSVPETKDRLSEARMQALVGRPVAIVESGDLEGGRVAFEQVLTELRQRHGPESVAVADALTSFGALLFNSGDHGSAEKLAAVDYLRRAVDATRAAFGSNHPEMALVLNTYADGLEVTGLDPSRDLIVPALSEALQIRISALGPLNIETLSGLNGLVHAMIVPQRLQRHPESFGEAEAVVRRHMGYLEAAGGPKDPATRRVEVLVAHLHARRGRIDDAIAVLRRLEREAGDRHHDLPFAVSKIADDLAAVGDIAGSKRLEKAFLMNGSGLVDFLENLMRESLPAEQPHPTDGASTPARS